MRLIHVACALAVLALAACELSPEVSSSTSGNGAAGGPATSQQGGAGGSGAISSQQVGAPTPGTPRDFVVNVGDRVHFGFDKYNLSPKARAIIENQVVWLKRYPNVHVTIEGNTDQRGTREYNLALGARRANSVRDYMIALGISPDRITTISYGKERPVDPASTPEAWAKNRRAVTVIDSKSS